MEGEYGGTNVLIVLGKVVGIAEAPCGRNVLLALPGKRHRKVPFFVLKGTAYSLRLRIGDILKARLHIDARPNPDGRWHNYIWASRLYRMDDRNAFDPSNGAANIRKYDDNKF